MTPQQEAQRILGPIDWQSPTQGFCQCPGQHLHTKKTGKRACRVHLDGAPTIYCFHQHCQPARDKANLELRRALAPPVPTLVLPGGAAVAAGRDCSPSGPPPLGGTSELTPRFSACHYPQL